MLFAHYSCLIASTSEACINEAAQTSLCVFVPLGVGMLKVQFLTVFLVFVDCLAANPTGKEAT